jgi:3'-phosphoadenosine 5'-phosphosulfate sulfotransferase (PAPS reductase)/FAD synthetase
MSNKPALGRSGATENKSVLSDIMPVEKLISLAVTRVNEVIAATNPVYVSAGLSGGHDSVTATFIASKAVRFDSALHIDTGVGLKATEEFVQSLCSSRGWNLEVFRALENVRADGTADPQDYFQMIEERGFPGPGMHWKMYQRLKQRQIERFCRAHKKWRSREVIVIVSGRRKQESARRNQKVIGPFEVEGRVVWANPLWDFSKLDCTRIMLHTNLPRSPVVDLIHKSGECLCGAFGSREEFKETALWYAQDPTMQRLIEADSRLRCKFGWGWGEGKGGANKAMGPMCSSCDATFKR